MVDRIGGWTLVDTIIIRLDFDVTCFSESYSMDTLLNTSAFLDISGPALPARWL